MKKMWTVLFLLVLISCAKNDEEPKPGDDMYFPPKSGDEWETLSPATLGWDNSALDELYDYLADNGTRAFLILKNGKLVVEKYWGKNILNTADFDQKSQWYWASAGKSLTAVLVGIAHQQRLLDISDRTSDYLGTGWTSESREKEDLITIRHQLTMTTGLDYTTGDLDCTDPECLQYKADAGLQWYYHNAAYTLLENVVSEASGEEYNGFTDQTIEAATGMSGSWIKSGYLNIYWSTPRDMARFGLMILNRGTWDGQTVLRDDDYFAAMTSTSQNLNPAYGYLWWLNGKSSVIIPGLAASLPIKLAPNAPDEMIVAAGKNGQFADVIPSQKLVVIRMGETPGDALVPIQLHNEMWAFIAKALSL